ncbi:MAG: HAD-IIA family hydrolase [Hyphomicrobiales bacterium]|nr:HAD-IIA family hydrolase [Hyphomicrobiales bacterium]
MVLERYQWIRDRRPAAEFPATSIHAPDLSHLADEFDAFVLDAFGVLNVGANAVPGAAARVGQLQSAGKRVIVLTNGASFEVDRALKNLARLGFLFGPDQLVASRAGAFAALQAFPRSMRWGVAAAEGSRIDLMPADAVALADEPGLYHQVDGIVLLSSLEWTDARQELLVAALGNRPRPVVVANPDLVAPRETGLSLQPGHYAHDVRERTGVEPEFYGKPYPAVFEIVRERLGAIADTPERIAMVGDTLHTDILGGAAAGWRTVLVTDFGLLRGRDIAADIRATGIVPHFVVNRP